MGLATLVSREATPVRLCTRALRATPDTLSRATALPVLSGSSSPSLAVRLTMRTCTFQGSWPAGLGAPPRVQIRRVFRKYMYGWGAMDMPPFWVTFLSRQ